MALKFTSKIRKFATPDRIDVGIILDDNYVTIELGNLRVTVSPAQDTCNICCSDNVSQEIHFVKTVPMEEQVPV